MIGGLWQMKKTVKICPKCEKLVEANEYFSINGLTDARIEGGITNLQITCSNCDYRGLPVEINSKDYEKFNKKGK